MGKKNNNTKDKTFYIVSWADYNRDSDSLSEGTFISLYSTKRKAKKSILHVIEDAVRDEMESFAVEDKDGAEDISSIMERIVKDDGFSISVEFPHSGTRSIYSIHCYTTKYIV